MDASQGQPGEAPSIAKLYPGRPPPNTVKMGSLAHFRMRYASISVRVMACVALRIALSTPLPFAAGRNASPPSTRSWVTSFRPGVSEPLFLDQCLGTVACRIQLK